MPASRPPASRLRSPAAERNREPILQVLRRVLPARAKVLEIASGSGQHAAYFAGAMPGWQWQPTELDSTALPSIDAWCEGMRNVRPALQLDVMASDWPAGGRFDAMFCANMLHISPWSTCAALMRGSVSVLSPAGLLVNYGPFLQDDVQTSAGNLTFDASLRMRNRAWGLRRVEDVAQVARRSGLHLDEIVSMPANNLMLVFRQGAPGAAPASASA